MGQNILAIDQGTTSSRAIVFSPQGQVLAQAQAEFTQHFPDNGWVEHDAQEIWQVTCRVCRAALAQLPDPGSVAGIGITNQRETAVVWDKRSGEPVYPAIVWQDRRTAARCQALIDEGCEPMLRERTGLCSDAYFSATKIEWILQNVAGVRQAAQAGHIAVGTVDSWLIWKFTEGKSHVTDVTNASRTLLFNIHDCTWDQELIKLFGIPEAALPQVLECASAFGTATTGLDGLQLPIAGVAGDQQAAVIGQACFERGMVKSTYGTGCFALMNIGGEATNSSERLLTTIAYRIGGRTTYALEGAIFSAGSSVQWLRDELGIIEHAAQTETLAASVGSNHGVYLVPAFTGLGTPHWQPQARAMLCGLTRDSNRAHIARAALEAVCYQTRDLLGAMTRDSGLVPASVRVDGGMMANNWLVQCLADILEIKVQRPSCIETTALGAARLAALELGLFNSLDQLAEHWQLDSQFDPKLDKAALATSLNGWQRAVSSCVQHAKV